MFGYQSNTTGFRRVHGSDNSSSQVDHEDTDRTEGTQSNESNSIATNNISGAHSGKSTTNLWLDLYLIEQFDLTLIVIYKPKTQVITSMQPIQRGV